MFNAEEIIELEKKWFRYKIKQKSKLYIIILFTFSILSVLAYVIFFQPKFNQTIQPVEKKQKVQKVKIVKKIKTVINETNTTIKNTNITIFPIESNSTKTVKPIKVVVKKDNSKPYHFKLEPTEQGSELFSSNGYLTLNLLNEKKKITPMPKTVQPIREISTIKQERLTPKKKPKISIDMQEVDTISYLKDKYYSTSSIVFALMLAEEYYYEKEYKNSLKWALAANDIDSQNSKSWYWFAKAKVRLDKKDDAIRALKAYLSNNNSKRLSTLLHKIELGDTDD